jgi:TRAP-type C4-dicarboxylate transport system permease large subunit
MAKDVPMIETFKGVIPFFLSDAVRVAFIVWLPSLTLFLPHLLVSD